MRNLTLVGALMLIGAGPAAAEAKKTAKTPEKVHCPVMAKNLVSVKDATAKKMFADHKGRRYFFCCAGCPDAFKKDPAKFAKAESIPTPKS